MSDELHYGELVTYRYAEVEMRGTVREVYGPENDRRVVLDLTPELNPDLVVEPTTISWPADRVKRVVAA